MKVWMAIAVVISILGTLGLLVKGVKFFHGLIDSLTTEQGGYSARKIVAYFGVIMAGILSVKHTNHENADSIITTWLVFVSVCLGIVTASQLIQLKLGSSSSAPSDKDGDRNPKPSDGLPVG